MLRYFHVVAEDATEVGGMRSHDQIVEQFDVLKRAFNKHNINFKHAGTTQTVNPDWAENCAELEMKEPLHRGTYADLNVYLHPRLRCAEKGSTYVGVDTLGFGKRVCLSQIADGRTN
jgi:hypothetical protein